MLMRCLDDLIRHVVIKCNVRVIEGRVNEVIEVRSLSVCYCCCYCCCCCCCYYMSHVIKDKVIECMLLMFMCDAVIEGECGGRGPGGMGLTPLHTYCVPLPICKIGRA